MFLSYAWLLLDLALFLFCALAVSPFLRGLASILRTFSARSQQVPSAHSSESSQHHVPIATIAPPLKNRHA